MYPGKVCYSILPQKHNLKNVILETKASSGNLLKHSLSLCQFSSHLQKNHWIQLLENGQILKSFRRHLLSVSESLKNQSSSILRVWTHQCECVVAQRLRRGQQMFCLYSKIWEEHALKQFLHRMRLQVSKRSKEFVFSAIGIAAYNWEDNRIHEDEIKEYVHELEYMRVLKENTMICQLCRNSNRNNHADKTALHCNCPNRKSVYLPFDDWSVFIEKQDMIIWRRLHKCGSYEYKVYGSFNDVTADDFLNVQIDIDYRKQWDSTAVTLNIIERDPNPTTNSDIIYWEMSWPRLFANRDYVFKRRYLVDTETKTAFLVSKCTEHPNCPVEADKHRVGDYWSHMVIRPYSKFSEPGLEFGLTYFDNPGINIPSAVTAWVAYRAMPEFLGRLRCAAREYHNYCSKNGVSKACCLRKLDGEMDPNEDESCKNRLTSNGVEIRTENIVEEFVNRGVRKEPADVKTQDFVPGVDIMTSPSPILQTENRHSYWKYLQPTYYFS